MNTLKSGPDKMEDPQVIPWEKIISFRAYNFKQSK